MPRLHPVPRLHRWGWIGLLVCIACGGAPPRDPNQQPTFPVRGQVLLDDQPLRNVVIMLHPTDVQPGKTVRSYARSDAAGNFEVSTYQPGDGAPAGHYAVTILPDADETGDRLPERYSDLKRSGLSVEVKHEPNILPALRLRR